MLDFAREKTIYGVTLALALLGAPACGSDDGGGDATGDATGDGDHEATGDGDGDPSTGDGDGDPSTGDGDGDPSTGDGDGDPSTGDGDGDPTTGDGDCSDLVSDNPVMAELVDGQYPTAAGGTIADGTYILTKWEVYPPETEVQPAPRYSALRFSNGTVEVYENNPFIDFMVTASGTYLDGQDPPAEYPPDTLLNFMYSCPGGGYGKLYTATANELIWFEIQPDKNQVWTYTKQ